MQLHDLMKLKYAQSWSFLHRKLHAWEPLLCVGKKIYISGNRIINEDILLAVFG